MVAPISSKIDLHGRTALVVGAARGIGQAIAFALAREGADIIASDQMDTRETESSIAATGRKVIGVRCDVSKKQDVTQLVDKALAEFGNIDILASCAGVCHRTALSDLDEGEWDRELAINLKGTFLIVQAVIPHMKARKYGKIVCIGSIAGKVGGVISGPHYVASKGGIHAFIKWVAKDAASDSVYINGIAPGPVKTTMTDGFPYYDDMAPLGRLGDVEDIAEAALFLASQASNWITGIVLDVNGGMLMS